MKPRLLALALLALSGCNGIDRLLWGEKKEHPRDPVLIAVSCCREADGSYPATVPSTHIQLCDQVRQANHNNQLINGDAWLAMGTDCGRFGRLGDEYYQ